MKPLPLPESGPFGVMKRWSWGTAESVWISVHIEGPERCLGRYRLSTELGHSDNRTPDSGWMKLWMKIHCGNGEGKSQRNEIKQIH